MGAGAIAIMAADRTEKKKKTIGISKQTDERERKGLRYSVKYKWTRT